MRTNRAAFRLPRRLAVPALLLGAGRLLLAQSGGIYEAKPQRNVVPPPEISPTPAPSAAPANVSEAAVREAHDVDGALRLAWAAFNANRLDEAAGWFRLAREWDPGANGPDATLGLALIAQRQGRAEEAAELARPLAKSSAPLRTLLADTLSEQAGRAREAKRFSETAARLAELESVRPLGREERVLRAWNRLDLGESEAAARDFEALYREEPGPAVAEGLFVSASRAAGAENPDGVRARLEPMAREVPGGPLAALVANRLGPGGRRAVAAQTSPPARVVTAKGRSQGGDSRSATETAEGKAPPSKQGDELFAQALRAEQAGRYAESLAALGRLETQHRPLRRDERILRAWNRFHLNDFAGAGDEFTVLYREGPDPKIAEGVFYSREKAGRLGELDALERAVPGGPLGRLLAEARGRRLLDRGLPLAARAAFPTGSAPAAVRNADSPTVTINGIFREKSGGEGTSRLSAETLPGVDLAFVGHGVDEVRISVARQTLDSGSPPAGAAIGSAPVTPTPFRVAPTARAENLVTPTLSWRREGWLGVFAALGSTPLNGPVGALPVGSVGVVQQTAGGEVRASAFAGSVTETVLSTVGVRDPFTGKAFGRVVETGVTLGGFQSLGAGWSVSGSLTLAALVGERVAENWHARTVLGLGRNFALPGFRYFSVGPGVFLDHFGRNENFFTVGHGGYFSPEWLAQPTVGLNFQTAGGRAFVLEGGAAVGGQRNRQASAEFFPLGRTGGDARRYPATLSSSLVFSARLAGVWRVGEHWQVGADVDYRKSADYNDLVGLLFVRYGQEGRPAVFGSDLVRPVF